MKVKPEQLVLLNVAIVPLDTAERRAQYRAGDFPRSEGVKDLNKRYRWDLYWACDYKIPYNNGINDAHIDTALRSVVEPL